MAQVNKISKNNTHIYKNDKCTEVWLHDTCIVQVYPDKITLNTGGWYTTTTRTRMNQVSNEWKLGYSVGFSQRDGYGARYRGKEYPFNADHICVIPREEEN